MLQGSEFTFQIIKITSTNVTGMEFEILWEQSPTTIKECYPTFVTHLASPQSANMTHTTETERCIPHHTSSPFCEDSPPPEFLDIEKEDFMCLEHLSINSPPPSPLLSSLPSSSSSSPPSLSSRASVVDGSIEKASSPKVETTSQVLLFSISGFCLWVFTIPFSLAMRRSSTMQTSRLIFGLLHCWKRKRP